MPYADVIHLQGNDFDAFERVLYPSTATTPNTLLGFPDQDAAMDYLAQWDMGEYPEVRPDAPTIDNSGREYKRDDYIMTYSTSYSWAALVRRIED